MAFYERPALVLAGFFQSETNGAGGPYWEWAGAGWGA